MLLLTPLTLDILILLIGVHLSINHPSLNNPYHIMSFPTKINDIFEDDIGDKYDTDFLIDLLYKLY